MSYKNRTGEEKLNSNGTLMRIINQFNYAEVEVEFQDKHKYKTKAFYQNFKRGVIKNPYDKTVCGVGCIGDGKYKTGGKDYRTKQYAVWEDMMYRCYKESLRHLNLSYYDCTVCEDWHNFQTFAKWYDNNFYTIGIGRMHIDKDILVKDNKVYSPETCMFVPQRINMIFMKKNREVDKDLPSGIRRCVGGYQIMYNAKYLGIFKELNKGLEIYNIEKQLHINKVAEEYKKIIPPKLYDALLNWNCKLAA